MPQNQNGRYLLSMEQKELTEAQKQAVEEANSNV